MIGKKFCPNCGSEDVDLAGGGVMGIWICRECGYSGSIFPEKPFIGGETREISEEDIQSINPKRVKKTRRKKK